MWDQSCRNGEDRAKVNDVQKLLDESPMSRAQTVAVIIIGLLSALDGYDVLAMTFAAPGVSAEFDVGKAALGLALSSGLVGMALGSFFMAPLGDRFGRRSVVLISLVLMCVGMLMSAFVTSIVQLAAWRVVPGIGIGSLIPVLEPLAAEFSNASSEERGVGHAGVSRCRSRVMPYITNKQRK